MTRRIFRNVVLIAVLAVLLTAALIVPAMYSVYERQMRDELRTEANYIVHALDAAADELAYFDGLRSDNRITLIAADGVVRYDNIAEAGQMENHADRPEVAQALAEGWGEGIRRSDTLSDMTVYYAQKTAAGDVLRIAAARSSILRTFAGIFPLVAAVLLCIALLSLAVAGRAARRIVAPLNRLNLESPLENETYDELAPLLTRMEQQHSQIQRQLQALERARAEMSAIMENMREGMLLLDTSGTLLTMNGSAARIFDVDAETCIGKNLLAVNRDADLHELVQAAQGGVCGDLLIRRGEKSYQIYASAVLKEQKSCGVVLLLLDVTERFAAESSRREFTANVSHELKTPLTAISGFAEIIRDGIAPPQDAARFAGKICDEARRLIALVNDILELSRLDERQGLGKRERVPLKEMLQGLMDDFAPLARQKKLSLTLEAGDVWLQGYPVLLREMLFNLIDNAVKYTPENGSVVVSAAERADGVECAVRDTGVGIPPEHQQRVFERFYRVDKSHSRATGGTGLGLAIVRHVAEIHHAELNLQSRVGEGTTITLRFRNENSADRDGM